MPAGRSALLVALVFAGPVTGCASGPEKKKADEAAVESLRAQNAAYMRQIEELENQVFVLSDQDRGQDTNAKDGRGRSAAVSTPVLPKVKLQPGTEVDPADEDTSFGGAGEGYSSFGYSDGTEVEYAGEAAKSSSARPVLRLVGDSGSITLRDHGNEEVSPVSASASEREHEVALQGESAGPRERLPARPPARPVPRSAATTTAAAPGRAPAELYRRSLDHLTRAAHAEAAAGFREFLRRFPGHDYADNAQYWLGECYYDLKDFPSAAREFRRVVDDFPGGNKVPDALLKAAFAHLASGQVESGRRTLQELVRAHPKHPAATLAAEKLAALGGVAAASAATTPSSKESP
jgi:tol-pal system protein YbgF